MTIGKAFALSAILAGSFACGASPESEKAADGPRYFEATGRIVSVEESMVVLDHGDIPGFMDAMTMSFPVTDPSLLRELAPGMEVSFRVVVDKSSYAIDQINPR